MTISTYHLQLDDKIKKQSFAVIEDLGLSPTQAINQYLEHIALTKSMPVFKESVSEEKIPSQSTLDAIDELEQGGGTVYANAEEAMQAMLEIAHVS